MFNALLIGCGNIGALYDINNDQVLTHAKALNEHPEFALNVFDTDAELAARIGTHYNVPYYSDITKVNIGSFDCVSVCSPTNTHYDILSHLLKEPLKLIICEKPVCNNTTQLETLAQLYENRSVKMMVNYIRRFLPAYSKLKQVVQD